MPEKLTLTGDKKLDRIFDELQKGAKGKIVRKGLREASKIIADETRKNAPIGETGNLSKNTKVKAAKRKRGRIGLVVQINSPDAHYAGWVEFGTLNEDGSWRITPRRFMTQAFDNKEVEATQRAIESFSDEIEKIIKK